MTPPGTTLFRRHHRDGLTYAPDLTPSACPASASLSQFTPWLPGAVNVRLGSRAPQRVAASSGLPALGEAVVAGVVRSVAGNRRSGRPWQGHPGTRS